MDRLTKSAHFLSMKTTSIVDILRKIHIREIIRLHSILVLMVSDRGSSFTSRFQNTLQKALGTQLVFSSAYHLQTDCQTERVNQELGGILKACVLDFQGSWEGHLQIVELTYNNSYHSTIGMAPYETLYGRPCRSLIYLAEPEDILLLGRLGQ